MMNLGETLDTGSADGRPGPSPTLSVGSGVTPAPLNSSTVHLTMTVDSELGDTNIGYDIAVSPLNAETESLATRRPSALDIFPPAGLNRTDDGKPSSSHLASKPYVTGGDEGKKQSECWDADENFLLKHTKHVFILTSAGKPIFSRYGNENTISELFGVFQVLITMAQQKQDGGTLHWINAADLTIYFHVDGGLYYVLVTRGGESPYSCRRQLKQLHYQLLSLVPNVNDILSRCPSYDLRRLVSPTDGGVLRQLIKRNSREECYMFRCLAASPLSVASRCHLTSILTQHYRSGFSKGDISSEGGVAADCHLFSFFFFRGRVVCMVGLADGKVSLHIDDTLILLNFVRCLPLSQVGEIWAPLCLPRYNDTGYLWCYCTDMGAMVNELDSSESGYVAKDDHHGVEKPTAKEPFAEAKRSELLLVQVASSQLAFAPLSMQAHCIAQMLQTSFTPLIDELEARENIPLSLALPNVVAQRQQEVHEKISRLLTRAEQQYPECLPSASHAPSSLQLPPVPVHPYGLQWFALILKQPSNVIYSEPSPAMKLDPRLKKRQLRLLVRLRYELALRTNQNEQLLVLNTEEVNVVVMKPTPNLLTSLVQQFGSRDECVNNVSLSSGNAAALCSHLQELLLLFSPHVPKHQMLLCAVSVAVGVMARECELSLQQPRSSKSRVW